MLHNAMPEHKLPPPGEPIRIRLADKELTLRYSLRTLKDLDVDHGLSVLKGTAIGEAWTDPTKLALILFYGLRGNEGITQDWVEDNIDSSMLLDLAPVLAYATTGRKLKLNLPEEVELPNVARPNGTGLPSGPSAASISDAPKPNSGA